jgi:uncharacterized radical SAM protein YgiQ
VLVYANRIREAFKDIPIIIGGTEASLRRFAHYDYWSDTVRRSILVDSRADLLIYGMGEKPLKEIVRKLKEGVPLKDLRNIPQTAFVCPAESLPDYEENTKQVAGYEECVRDGKEFAQAFRIIEEESNKQFSARIIQRHGNRVVVVNPPYSSYTQEEIDEPYDLFYNRQPHPRYQKKEAIPAFEMIRHSVNIHRGCFGGCSFCTISAHQGKFVLRGQNLPS